MAKYVKSKMVCLCYLFTSGEIVYENIYIVKKSYRSYN